MNPLEKSLSHADPVLEKIRIHRDISPNYNRKFHLPPSSPPQWISPSKISQFSSTLKNIPSLPLFRNGFRTAEHRLRFTSHLPKNPIHQYQHRTVKRSIEPGKINFQKARKLVAVPTLDIYIYIYRICIDRWEGA